MKTGLGKILAPTLASAFLLVAAVSAGAQSYAVELLGTNRWTDTKIDVRGGEKLKFTVDGTITFNLKNKTFGPRGLGRGYSDVVHELAIPDGSNGELIGRLGAGDTGQPFEIGGGLIFTAPVAERLYLGINESRNDAAQAAGSFHVTIEVLEAGSGTSLAAETSILELSGALLDSLPRHVSDKENRPGDMVNVLLVGSDREVLKAFTTAGWVQVDRTVSGTIKAGVLDTFHKKDYLTMPMSTLYLFDRPQDYGFAHAEPVQVIRSRHHLRVWKSTNEVNGRPLWCVAATHDVGIERDRNGLTHKIDPAIDDEREYVNNTLSATGLVVKRGHLAPSNPLTLGKTAAGGDEFHSDGRVLALVLKEELAVSK